MFLRGFVCFVLFVVLFFYGQAKTKYYNYLCLMVKSQWAVCWRKSLGQGGILGLGGGTTILKPEQ